MPPRTCKLILMPNPAFILLTLSQMPLPGAIQAQFFPKPDCTGVAQTSVLNLSVADTESKRTRGLSGKRVKLAQDQGMVFVFNPAEPVKFWMKETYIPLSIAYVGPDSKLIAVLEMPVEKNPKKPTKTYGPENAQPVAFAIEVGHGEFKKLGDAPAYLCYVKATKNP